MWNKMENYMVYPRMNEEEIVEEFLLSSGKYSGDWI